MEAAETARVMQEQFFPAIKGYGATQFMMVMTGEETGALITIYPDKATRDAAAEKIAAGREKGKSIFGSEMTGEIMGEVIASF